MPRISARTVSTVKPEAGRQVFLWDEGLPGFGVCVQPSGVRSFIIQYRNGEGRSRRMVLGKLGTLTPDEGRTRGGPGVAARTLGMLATILEHARHHGLVSENQARGVKKLADKKASRFLSGDEIRALGAVMQAAGDFDDNQIAVAAVRLLLL